MLGKTVIYKKELYKVIMILQHKYFMGLRLQRLSDDYLIDVVSSEVELAPLGRYVCVVCGHLLNDFDDKRKKCGKCIYDDVEKGGKVDD